MSVDARARDGARCAAQNRESYTTDIHTRMKHDTSTTNLQLDAAQQQSQTCYTNAPAYGTPSCHPARHAAFVSIHDADRALGAPPSHKEHGPSFAAIAGLSGSHTEVKSRTTATTKSPKNRAATLPCRTLLPARLHMSYKHMEADQSRASERLRCL